MRVITVFVAALAAAFAGTGQRAAGEACREHVAAPAYRAAIAEARPLLRKLNSGLGAPGLSLTIATHGRIVWSTSCGYADVRSRRPVTAGTRFRIGSVTKPLTATALASLADTGRIDLDAPVQRYVPSFPAHGGGITLRRLAGHLAGIRHYGSAAEAVNRRHFAGVGATLRIFAHDPLVARPGTRYSYSSYGYDLIGAALERASRTSYANLLHRTVLAPAGMRHTTLGTAPAAQRTAFYEATDRGGFRLAPPIDLSDRLPAGGVLSTADDLARFGLALTGGKLVGAATAKLMFTSQRTTAGHDTGYGLGFEVQPSPFGTFVGHTGAVDGGTAGLLIHPASGAVLALTTNLGYATAAAPHPPKPGTPDPPALLLPFVR
jgi:CubicO group peptidase (beta-lactamase class C family)